MPRHLLWWGGVALTLGGVVFCLATTGRLAGQFNAVHYTTVQKVTSPPVGEVTRGCLEAALRLHAWCHQTRQRVLYVQPFEACQRPSLLLCCS